jgi:small subunit ribosomal protein S1
LQNNEIKEIPVDDSEHPMNFLLAEDLELGFPKAGDIREGEVVAQRSTEILVDIGAKSEGIIPVDELNNMDDETLEHVSVGNTITIAVIEPEDRNGNIIVSYFKALEEEDWLHTETLLETQEAVECKVVGFNRGGLLAMLGRLRGFVPSSQLLAGRGRRPMGATNEERFGEYLNEILLVRVIEVERKRNRLILSERAAMKEIQLVERQKQLEELEEGAILDGTVVNLVDFGAFVDIGSLEGLVHLSEMSWKRINHPSELMEIGQKLQVYVLNVDQEKGRVALSTKRLQPDPWSLLDETYMVGELIEATITKLTNYGAFARVNDEYELEGLIHISELASERIEHPREIVERGDIVALRIIKLDSTQRQMGLSIKQVTSDEYLESDLALAESMESE